MTTLRLIIPQNLEADTVDFDAADFRRALFQKGLEMDWDWSQSCPCQTTILGPRGVRVKISENPITCEGCKGSGILYSNRTPTYGMLLDSTSDQKFANLFGRYADGAVLITLLPEHVPCLNDRLTLKRGVCVYEETFTHSETTERPRFPIVKRKMWVGVEGNQFEAELITVGVLYMRSADAAGVLLPIVYVENTHFEVDDNGFIVWFDGYEPVVGTRISIRYFGRPHFIVKGFPHTRRDLYLNDNEGIEDRNLVSHPVRVVCEPEFFGARNPPVVTDVGTGEPNVRDPNEP